MTILKDIRAHASSISAMRHEDSLRQKDRVSRVRQYTAICPTKNMQCDYNLESPLVMICEYLHGESIPPTHSIPSLYTTELHYYHALIDTHYT